MRIPKPTKNIPNKTIQAHIGIYISINKTPPPIKIMPIRLSIKEFLFGQRDRLLIMASHPYIVASTLAYALLKGYVHLIFGEHPYKPAFFYLYHCFFFLKYIANT